MNAVVAQPVEQCFRKAPVVGSNPTNGSRKGLLQQEGPLIPFAMSFSCKGALGNVDRFNLVGLAGLQLFNS